MPMWGIRIALAGIGLLAVTACASVVGSTSSDVQIRTKPDKARCELRGFEGYSATIETPATVTIPTKAAPVTVTCAAPGFRPSSYTLDASANGWIWGNTALMTVTGGVAVLGALVDETRSAGRSYAEEVQYDLSPERPRPVRVRTRSGETELHLQAR